NNLLSKFSLATQDSIFAQILIYMKYLFGFVLTLSFLFSAAQEDGFTRPDIPGEVMIDIGFNSWSVTPDTLDRKGWASKSLGIYYAKRYRISNKFSFLPGIGLGLEKMGFESGVTFQDSALFYTRVPYTGITKNKIAFTYLDIPVELRFHPKGTEDGEGFFVSAGGMFGLKMGAHTKIKYDEGDGVKKLKETGKFNLESFRYGYQVRIGFKGVHLFYKKYLSNAFKEPIQGADPTMKTIGINVTGF
ncbi:MAG: outer membrane beta-barrel protein, partial [Cyclobacteriaceae bacterium]